jgi:hypothetical protein
MKGFAVSPSTKATWTLFQLVAVEVDEPLAELDEPLLHAARARLAQTQVTPSVAIRLATQSIRPLLILLDVTWCSSNVGWFRERRMMSWDREPSWRLPDYCSKDRRSGRG